MFCFTLSTYSWGLFIQKGLVQRQRTNYQCFAICCEGKLWRMCTSYWTRGKLSISSLSWIDLNFAFILSSLHVVTVLLLNSWSPFLYVFIYFIFLFLALIKKTVPFLYESRIELSLINATANREYFRELFIKISSNAVLRPHWCWFMISKFNVILIIYFALRCTQERAIILLRTAHFIVINYYS